VPLVLVGLSAQTLTNAANGLLQLSTEPAMRGRVVALFLAIALGGTPLGAPLVGWVADRFGPRWALCVGAAGGFAAAAIAVYYLVRFRGLRLRFDTGRVRFQLDERDAPLLIKGA